MTVSIDWGSFEGRLGSFKGFRFLLGYCKARD